MDGQTASSLDEQTDRIVVLVMVAPFYLDEQSWPLESRFWSLDTQVGHCSCVVSIVCQSGAQLAKFRFGANG